MSKLYVNGLSCFLCNATAGGMMGGRSYCGYHLHMTGAITLLQNALREIDFASNYRNVDASKSSIKCALSVATTERNDAEPHANDK